MHADFTRRANVQVGSRYKNKFANKRPCLDDL